jgi:hypothetical protein
MALTEKNQLLIAFKKLYGKSHTNAKFGIFNESAASSVQLGISKIFGQNIPSSPSSSLYSITNGTVEKIKFNLASITLSSYSNTLGSLAGTTIDDEGDTSTSGIHAYKLVLPSDYESNTFNTKVGSAPFVNSTTASDSNGTLQLIPPSFGDSYLAEVSSSTGIISGLDDEDYYIDYYAGILFVQDINRTPTAVTAYAYVADYGAVSASFAISASFATTASYAANAAGITSTAYNNLREISTGSFDADGTKTIELQKFLNTDLDYISLNIFTQPSGTNIYTNDILSIEMSGNLNNKISISLSAPSYNNKDKYKIIAVKESI